MRPVPFNVRFCQASRSLFFLSNIVFMIFTLLILSWIWVKLVKCHGTAQTVYIVIFSPLKCQYNTLNV